MIKLFSKDMVQLEWGNNLRIRIVLLFEPTLVVFSSVLGDTGVWIYETSKILEVQEQNQHIQGNMNIILKLEGLEALPPLIVS